MWDTIGDDDNANGVCTTELLLALIDDQKERCQ